MATLIRYVLAFLPTGFILFHWNAFPPWLPVYLAVMSGITFFVYGYDKAQARGRNIRVSERTLHVLSLLGGSPGAALGRVVFRHKINSLGFRVIFAIIVVIQLGLAIWLLKANG